MANPGPASNVVYPTQLQIGSLSLPYRTIYPNDNLTALTALQNGTMNFQYFPCSDPLTASRLDALFAWSVGSTTTTNTFGLIYTAMAGIYSNISSTLSALSTGSTTTSYTMASNSGQTQLYQNAVRAISVPIAVTMYPGEYLVGFCVSTNTVSVGAATTALGQTISMYGGTNLQTALNYAIEFTNATAVTAGLFAGMGQHSVTQSAPQATYAQSDISGTGAPLANANIAIVFRNQ